MTSRRERFIIMNYRVLGFLLTQTRLSFTSGECNVFLKSAQTKTYDVVIVPGVPFEKGKWGAIMKARILWAKYLYDEGIVSNIMFSGAAVYTPYIEGEIMALYAIALGIPREHIFTEIKAEHGTENVHYGFQKSKKMGFSSLALASDPYQSKSLYRFTKQKVSDEIAMLPIVFNILSKIEPFVKEPAIDTSTAYESNWVSIKERMGFFRRFQGTRGLDIDPQAY
ncbi:MAG: YdcF family protein [Bacteroidota bacterium]